MDISASDVNESQRLAELMRLKAMENIVEETYKDITRLAASTCQTPIASITLVDSEHQWFLAPYGLNLTNTPRAISFCHHTIAQNDLFVIENSNKDPRFKDNPLVTGDLLVCFYAGAPLKTSKGYNIGALCVIDHTERHLNQDQLFFLKVLARLITLQLESTLATTDLNITMSRLHGFLDNLTFAVLVEDRQGKVAFINDLFCQYFSLPPDSKDLIDQDSRHIFARIASLAEHPERCWNQIKNLVDSRESVVGDELTLRDGRVFEQDYIPTLVADRYEGHIWIYRDVTKKKEAERILDEQKSKLASAQKMAALGEMAAGISHEINNALAIIHAQSHYLRMHSMKKSVEASFVSQTAQSIVETTERMAKVIRSLREFSGKDSEKPFMTEKPSSEQL